MKSQAMLGLVAAVSSLTIIGIFAYFLAYQTQAVQRNNDESAIKGTFIGSEFLKRAVEQSLAYSTYQGLYETLSYGNYPIQGCTPQKSADGTPFWSTDGTVCLPPDNLQDPIQNKIQSTLMEYISALSTKYDKCKIPSYTTAVQNLGNSIKVTGTTVTVGDKIDCNNNDVEIKPQPNIVQSITISLNDLIAKGKQIVNQDPIRQQVQSAADQTLAGCRVLSKSQCGGPPSESAQQLLDENCLGVKDRFSNSIQNNVNSLGSGLSTDKISASVQTASNLKTTVDGSCSDPSSQPDSTCGCATWSCQGDGCIHYQSGPCASDPLQICQNKVTDTPVCTQYISKFTKTCSYNYKAGVDAFVTISDKNSKKVPVYDQLEKSTALRYLSIAFAERSEPFGSVGMSLPTRPSVSQPSVTPQCVIDGTCKYVWPLNDVYRTITSPFGPRSVQFNDQQLVDFHTGIDISAPKDSIVTAAISGTVEETCSYNIVERATFDQFRQHDWDRGLQSLIHFYNYFKCGWPGQYVLVSNVDGRESLYIHLDSISVNRGDSVSVGQTKIGEVDTTGISTDNHLHFQICEQGNPINYGGKIVPYNPCKLQKPVDPCGFLNC